MPLERKKTLNAFREGKAAWGSYDEFPVGPRGTDPMPTLSRNRMPQPFYLVCEDDHVLIQMSGEGAIDLRGDEPARMRLVPGDTVYIPAGVPTRLFPDGENLQIRLKAEPPGREALAWYCERCGALVHGIELEPGIVQSQYLDAVNDFNRDENKRTCGGCGVVHAPVDLGDTAWTAVAEALRSEG